MQRDQSLELKQSGPGTQGDEEIVARLTQENFASFVSNHRYSVVWAAHDAMPMSYPASLLSQLGLFNVPAVRMGVVGLSKIDWNPSVQFCTRLGLDKLKLKPDEKGKPPTGFYLFAKGLPIGFHAGTVDLNKDGENLGPALMLGLLAAMLTGDGTTGLTVGGQVARWKAGERIAKEFSQLIQQHEASSA